MKQKTLSTSQSTSWIFNLTRALGFAILTGLLAQIKISLPWTPVPIVLSTVGVALTALLNNSKVALLSMSLYVGLGLIGIPWFAGANGGIKVAFGATFGYLIGFIIAAVVGAYLFNTFLKNKPVTTSIIVHTLIYLPGLIWLKLWLEVHSLDDSWKHVLELGLWPFILNDILKAVTTGIGIKAFTLSKK